MLELFHISVLYIFCNYEWNEALYVADGAYEAGFTLIIVLFILLIIVGAASY
ncbi:YjcZ family sporulation protein [Bacillus sp. EB600]|uniref:YjcZ family sporulation protein n=1 Tax=Bacillus sp. EB600 TaxID=2806345 RepID=UPI0027351C05|nr:YjcZ family sporulation protein [Bacillus sp. EB600]MCQ6282222.1 YjcZ family sporulation protein [Bacillus sp. EB600]